MSNLEYHLPDALRVSEADDGSVSVLGRKGEKLGELISSEDERTHVQVKCLWSPDETSLAALVTWGTRMSDFSIYSRQKSGQFRKSPWKEPSITSSYKGASRDLTTEYRPQKWVKNNQLRVVIAAETFDKDGEVKYYVLDCVLDVGPTNVKTKSAKALGVLNNSAFQKIGVEN